MRKFIFFAFFAIFGEFSTKCGFIETDNEYEIHVTIEQYQNSRNRLENGKNCELFASLDKCDPKFIAAVYNFTNLLESFASRTFNNADSIREVGSFSFEGANIPETLKVKVDILDEDLHRNEIILNEIRFIKLRNKTRKVVEFSNIYTSVILTFSVSYTSHSVTTPSTKIHKKKFSTTNRIDGISDSELERFSNMKIICLTVIVIVLFIIIIILLVVMLRKYSSIIKRTKVFIKWIKSDAARELTDINLKIEERPQRVLSTSDEYNIYEDCV